jgi:putative PIN family toxin of toxin-antitoxin system
MRAVLDTNVLIAFLLTRGHIVSTIIQCWESGELEVVVSPQLLAELREVAGGERIAQKIEPGALQALLDSLAGDAMVVSGKLELPGATPDPGDDADWDSPMVVACAVESGAGFVVSRDRHLLDMGAYGDILIVSPEEFAEALEGT